MTLAWHDHQSDFFAWAGFDASGFATGKNTFCISPSVAYSVSMKAVDDVAAHDCLLDTWKMMWSSPATMYDTPSGGAKCNAMVGEHGMHTNKRARCGGSMIRTAIVTHRAEPAASTHALRMLRVLQVPPVGLLLGLLRRTQTPRLTQRRVQERRVHLLALGHNVESEQVAVDTFACHRISRVANMSLRRSSQELQLLLHGGGVVQECPDKSYRLSADTADRLGATLRAKEDRTKQQPSQNTRADRQTPERALPHADQHPTHISTPPIPPTRCTHITEQPRHGTFVGQVEFTNVAEVGDLQRHLNECIRAYAKTVAKRTTWPVQQKSQRTQLFTLPTTNRFMKPFPYPSYRRTQRSKSFTEAVACSCAALMRSRRPDGTSNRMLQDVPNQSNPQRQTQPHQSTQRQRQTRPSTNASSVAHAPRWNQWLRGAGTAITRVPVVLIHTVDKITSHHDPLILRTRGATGERNAPSNSSTPIRRRVGCTNGSNSGRHDVPYGR